MKNSRKSIHRRVDISDYIGRMIEKSKRERERQDALRWCQAKTRRGTKCKHKPINGTGCCKYHGGMSKGPKTIEGQIRALKGLKQYKARPDLLEVRIKELVADQDLSTV